MRKQFKLYNNGLDLGGFLDSITAKKNAEAQAELLKAQALSNLANQPAQSTNKWIIIIPVVVVIAGGITAYFLFNKKK